MRSIFLPRRVVKRLLRRRQSREFHEIETKYRGGKFIVASSYYSLIDSLDLLHACDTLIIFYDYIFFSSERNEITNESIAFDSISRRIWVMLFYCFRGGGFDFLFFFSTPLHCLDLCLKIRKRRSRLIQISPVSKSRRTDRFALFKPEGGCGRKLAPNVEGGAPRELAATACLKVIGSYDS